MKTRLSVRLGLFVSCLLICVSAHAAPITIGEGYNMSFSGGTCQGCWGNQLVPNVTFSGLLTVAPVTGAQLWDPIYGAYYSSGLMVTALSGTLDINCRGAAGCTGDGTYALSFLQANPGGDGWSAPRGDGSWLLLGSIPRYLVVSADGSGLNTRFINDNAFNLFQWSSPETGYGSQAPVTFTTTRVPEPSSFALLGIGFSAVLGVAGRRTRKRPLPQA